jgi:hypothetical protein
VRGGGGVGQSKAMGQQEAVLTAMTMTLTTMRWEEAIAMITIMTTIMMAKVCGGCKGTAHPGVGTTYAFIVIVLGANTRSSSTMTLALVKGMMMAILAAVQGGLV